jgi:formate hydrogenlyase subunit 3/multisubunit Na+/H+ antiporter MnhD subunit
MSDTRLWLAGLVALPALVIGISFLHIDVERLRRLAVASAIAMVLAALAIPLSPSLRDFSIRTAALTWMPGGEELIRVDTLSSALLPLAAGLWLLTVAVTPRAALDRRGLRRTALATLLTLTSFLTESAVVLLLLWAAAVWTFLSALGDPAHRDQRRVVAVYLGASTLLLAVGVALVVSPGVQGTRVETVAMWLIVLAALVRKGIVPFHAWVPEVFDRGCAAGAGTRHRERTRFATRRHRPAASLHGRGRAVAASASRPQGIHRGGRGARPSRILRPARGFDRSRARPQAA